MILRLFIISLCALYSGTNYTMDRNNMLPQKTQQSKKFDQQVKRWEQQLYKASNECNAPRCKELLVNIQGHWALKN